MRSVALHCKAWRGLVFELISSSRSRPSLRRMSPGRKPARPHHQIQKVVCKWFSKAQIEKMARLAVHPAGRCIRPSVVRPRSRRCSLMGWPLASAPCPTEHIPPLRLPLKHSLPQLRSLLSSRAAHQAGRARHWFLYFFRLVDIHKRTQQNKNNTTTQ